MGLRQCCNQRLVEQQVDVELLVGQLRDANEGHIGLLERQLALGLVAQSFTDRQCNVRVG